jgi:hypothetical protein
MPYIFSQKLFRIYVYWAPLAGSGGSAAPLRFMAHNLEHPVASRQRRTRSVRTGSKHGVVIHLYKIWAENWKQDYCFETKSYMGEKQAYGS